MSEIRQVMVAYTYYQNVAGVWLAVTPTTPLPVTMAAGSAPITREVQHNVAGYVAGADIIAAALAPIYDPCSFRVEAAFNAGGILRATITRGGNTQTVAFNHGVALTPNDMFRFDLMVFAGDTINYQYSVNANILVFRVQEIPTATS